MQYSALSTLFCHYHLSFCSDECENLRQALQIQQKAEKDTALNQLLVVKDKEIEGYKSELHQQVQYYKEQVMSNSVFCKF